MQRDVKNKHDRMCQHYELIKGNRIISQDVVKKMDACSILSSEICDIVNNRIENTEYKSEEEERVR